MRIGKTVVGIAGGMALASVLVALAPQQNADAARRRRGRSRGPLQLIDLNVGDFAGVAQNHVIEFEFTSAISKNSLDPATFQIRAENANGTGYTRQVPGDFQLFGTVVRFFPRLPTHLRDPDRPGQFYSEGTPRDDADGNAGLQPSTNYEVKVIGHPSISSVVNRKGRRLRRTYTARFSTAAETPKSQAFTTESYIDAPPPGFQFSNPPDKVANVVDQYAIAGGTREVPNAISVTLFGNQVPLSPDSVRQGSNVLLTLIERKGDPSIRKPIPGSPFIEQNFDTVRLVYQPRFPLPDVGVYSLRVTKDVKDLSDTFTFKNNPERLRLREVYDFLAAARDSYRRSHPGEEPEAFELADPPIDLIFDWPQGAQNASARATLKQNVLNLGDIHPDEVDPRAMVIFSTRNEPVSDGAIVIEFLENDGFFDGDISTAQWDAGVPGAVAAISTIAGGNASNGDYAPAGTETISIDDYAGREINWRRVLISPGVIVNLEGSRPFIIKALELQIEGELRADGRPGQNAPTGSYTNGYIAPRRGGLGGPGGGKGADGSDKFSRSGGTAGNPSYDLAGNVEGKGNTGDPGHDVNLVKANANDGGQGGRGGTTGTSTLYRFGGGGGGGGARTAGTPGSKSTASNNGQPTWDGKGGAGGAGSNNADLDPLVGGAGGGSGGNSTYYAVNGWHWNKTAGAGGGGGGALLIQTATVFTIGSSGVIRARGGRGGNGTGNNSTLNAGPGGGAGGGSLLLRSTLGFNFNNAGANLDVSGGAGGTQSGTYTSPFGGAGGTGYIRLESPNAAAPALAGATVGDYNPVGGGEPSYAYTTWITFGVEAPRLVNFSRADFDLSATSNDALFVEAQFAIEDPTEFGVPLVAAVDIDQNTTDTSEVSIWMPLRIVDRTGLPGGAFGSIPGQVDVDQVFDIAANVNNRNFQFFRFRYTFQLDDTQGVNDIFPNVARQTVNFQFNF